MDPKKVVKMVMTLVFSKVERMAAWRDDMLDVKWDPSKVESLAERKVLLMVGRWAYQ